MRNQHIESLMVELKSEFQMLERIRQEVLSKRSKGTLAIVICLGAAFLIGLLIANLMKSPVGMIFGLVVGVIGTIGCYLVFFSGTKQRYVMMFKSVIVAKVLKKIQPEMDYRPGMGISEPVFVNSRLFKQRPDRYASEDLFYGKIGKTKVTFSEVHAEEEHTSTDSDGNTTTSYSTIFQGVFFMADFNKHFRTPLSVMPDVGERHFGWLGKQFQKLGGGLQKMENPEFEQFFVVRGADAVEARYILTPVMQERLVELRKRAGEGFRVIFKDSMVCLALPNRADFFECDLRTPVKDMSQMRRIIYELQSCFQVVDELDLNTRIWTKE